MKKIILTITAILTFVTFQQSPAQDRWGFEFRPNIDIATQHLGNVDLEGGVGLEGSFSFRFMPHLAAYAGWSWNTFGVDQSFAGSDASFEETGYTFGLQFVHPIGQSDISYLLRSGATYNHIEIENNDGDIITDSGHGLGWQIEAGLSIQLSDKFSLLPSIRYRSLSRDIEIEETSTSVDLNYVSFGVGMNWSF